MEKATTDNMTAWFYKFFKRKVRKFKFNGTRLGLLAWTI